MANTAEHMRKISQGTRFSSEYQPKRYRDKSLMTIVKKKLFSDDRVMRFKGVDELDEDGLPTGRKVNVQIAMTSAEALMLKYVKMAESGSETIMKDLIDRVDGKAASTLIHKTDFDRTEQGLLEQAEKLEKQLYLLNGGTEIEEATIEIGESQVEVDKGAQG